jgi:outer membrane protein
MTRLLQAAITGFVSAALAGGLAAQQTAPAPPSTQLQVSLAEAVRRALDVQPIMVQARGDVRNAGATGRSAWGAFLPTVSTSASASRSNQDRFDPNSTTRLPPGYAYTGGLSASLELFDGFRRLANLKAASATQDAAGAGLVNQRYQTTLATQLLFFTALADEELVRVAEAQLQRAKEELQIAVNKFQVGAATRSDTLTATVDFGDGQLALLQANANLATAQAALGRQIGVDQPVRALPDTALPGLPDTTALRASALQTAPLVDQAEALARAAHAQTWSARSQYWPSLTVSYSNSRTGINPPNLPFFTSYPETFSWRFGLSWTLFNGFQREQSQVSASVASDIAAAQAGDARRQVNAQLTQQLAAVFTASAQITISGANVAAATEALRVTQERYRLGAGTLLDLLTAEANMTQAQVNQVQARYNYLIARAQVEALVGHPL